MCITTTHEDEWVAVIGGDDSHPCRFNRNSTLGETEIASLCERNRAPNEVREKRWKYALSRGDGVLISSNDIHNNILAW